MNYPMRLRHKPGIMGAAADGEGEVRLIAVRERGRSGGSEAEMALFARVVDGPTASGAYVVRIAPDRRGQAIDGLRATPQVVLAEPIDPGSQP